MPEEAGIGGSSVRRGQENEIKPVIVQDQNPRNGLDNVADDDFAYELGMAGDEDPEYVPEDEEFEHETAMDESD